MKKILHQPLAVRIFHWLFVAAIALKIITGLFISFGFTIQPLMLDFRTVRLIHITTGMAAVYLLVFRVYYAFFTRDYKNFSFSTKDVTSFIELIKYYLFIRKKPPLFNNKYNTGQKLVYLSWLLLVIYLTITGFILLYKEPLSPLARVLGGYQFIRLSKLIGTVYFAASVMVHIYLVLTEDPARLQSMFFGWLRVSSDEKQNRKE